LDNGYIKNDIDGRMVWRWSMFTRSWAPDCLEYAPGEDPLADQL
jgi:hypothetical protein